jgi:uncharacterized membrane protein HdeD (DUF308 family)
MAMAINIGLAFGFFAAGIVSLILGFIAQTQDKKAIAQKIVGVVLIILGLVFLSMACNSSF